MDRNQNAPYDLDVDWIPDCGYRHLERNPTAIPYACPDGVKPEKP